MKHSNLNEYYKEEVEALDKKIIVLPDYQSSNYALFLKSKEGLNDAYTIVHPKEVSEKLYQIINLINAVLEKL